MQTRAMNFWNSAIHNINWSMRFIGFLLLGLWCGLGVSCQSRSTRAEAAQTYDVAGVVREIKATGEVAVIQHTAIPGYMEAMTMPFKVKDAKELAGVTSGDEVRFRLLVTADESWIEGIRKTGYRSVLRPASAVPATNSSVPKSRHALLDYAFTNQLGQPVRLSDFKGQALAITFFLLAARFPTIARGFRKTFRKLPGSWQP